MTRKKNDLNVSISVNVEADIYLPKIYEKHAAIQNNKPENTDDSVIVKNVGSDKYKFEIIRKE